MFFGKTEKDIVHIKPQENKVIIEEEKIEAPIVEEKVLVEEPKKRGRKKKPEVKEEPIVEIQESIEKEPVYVVKQEEPKQKLQVKLKRPDDNYGVYDEF